MTMPENPYEGEETTIIEDVSVEEPVESPEDELTVVSLNEHGVYTGVVTVKRKDLHPTQHLAHIKECDLPVGRYKWDREKETFLPTAQQVLSATSPNADRAIFAALQAIQQTIPLPAETTEWMSWFKKSWDGIGSK